MVTDMLRPNTKFVKRTTSINKHNILKLKHQNKATKTIQKATYKKTTNE